MVHYHDLQPAITIHDVDWGRDPGSANNRAQGLMGKTQVNNNNKLHVSPDNLGHNQEQVQDKPEPALTIRFLKKWRF